MSAPIASSVVLPSDAGNSGKNMRTETKVVGGNTVHEQFVVPVQGMTVVGQYFAAVDTSSGTPDLAIQTSAQDGTTTGFFWLQNPVGSTITAVINSIDVTLSATAATAAPTSPNVRFQKFTFTGTASGASRPATPYQTGAPIAQLIPRVAVTGMAVTLLNRTMSFMCPAILTAVGIYGYQFSIYKASRYGYVRGLNLEIGPGEGIACYQISAGTASDPRIFAVNVTWMEVDLS